ncbi:UNVERIFIED_CONTAM: GntR family transcriptional regulator [Acetivibrio alkalicellulosi]
MVIKVLELFKSINLNKNLNTPLYLQLCNIIGQMIEKGTLLSDTKLPSVRQISSMLKINSVTVINCYRQLESKGYVYTKPGSGTYVSTSLSFNYEKSNCDKNVFLDEIYPNDDMFLINNGQIKIDANTINFASSTPTSDLFPVEDFKLVLNEVLDRDMGNAFNYQESQGYYPLRSSICTLLKNYQINCLEESIQIISGAQQGIDIIAKALLNQGDYVITESPTYTGAIAVFKSRGAEIADVDLDADGINLDLLEYNLKKYSPKLIYTIPSFHNPTGISYSQQKRKNLIQLAQKYNTYIIEDDYVSELDFEGKNFIPLRSFDNWDKVIFLKSFSKIFMPGLRFGFMTVPPKLKKHILEAKHSTDISTSGLIQRTFDLYIRKGLWQKNFNNMYEIYKKRYLKTISTLDQNMPQNVLYHRSGGGLNIWLSLPYSYMVNSLLEYSTSNNIVFAPGGIFYSSAPSKLNNIRLSFAAVPIEKIEPGIEKLCTLISRFYK